MNKPVPSSRTALTYEQFQVLPQGAMVFMPTQGEPDPVDGRVFYDGPPAVFCYKGCPTENEYCFVASGRAINPKGEHPDVYVSLFDLREDGPLKGKVFIATAEDVCAARTAYMESWRKAIADAQEDLAQHEAAWRDWKRRIARHDQVGEA